MDNIGFGYQFLVMVFIAIGVIRSRSKKYKRTKKHKKYIEKNIET